MNFLKYRYLWITISLVIIISGISYGIATKYRFDIDFLSGTRIQSDLQVDFDNNEIEDLVKDIIGTKPLVQKMSSGSNAVSITTDVINEEQVTQIIDQLKFKYPEMEDATIRNIQPAFGKNLINSSILAITVSIIFMLTYIGIRFKTLGFVPALTAIIALIHDVLIMLAIYGIFKFAINSTFVAVILTIIGYSINDTIIIYDRIRENKRKRAKSADLQNTINESITQTLPRTINTTITTLIVIVVVLIYAYNFNQQVLMEFAFPLTIGIITGSYSSIFIATLLWYIIDNAKAKSITTKK